MAKEWKIMHPAFTGSKTSIKLRGKPFPGADDRQKRIPGFDQEIFSKSSVLCIGAAGINSQTAPTLVRKGIGRLTLLDDDVVEPSNLNRQRFYIKDVGENKAVALARNLIRECIVATQVCGYPFRKRSRTWNYRRIRLSDPSLDGGSMIAQRKGCELCNQASE
jgi:hypothetical protein